MLNMPLVLALELAVLYLAGSYATTRLAGLLTFRSRGTLLGRVPFYLLVLPGVILHEVAHYLACLLTGTKVLRFVPFLPQRSASGRVVLGYVWHERRSFPIRTIIGLAPILLNPLGILLVTALLTPLSLAEVVNPRLEIVREGIFASGFLTGSPLVAALWGYLSLSFALGSVPSREDLSSVPITLLLFGGTIFVLGLLGEGTEDGIWVAINGLCAVAARVYVLPAVVAGVAAVVSGLWARTMRA